MNAISIMHGRNTPTESNQHTNRGDTDDTEANLSAIVRVDSHHSIRSTTQGSRHMGQIQPEIRETGPDIPIALQDLQRSLEALKLELHTTLNLLNERGHGIHLSDLLPHTSADEDSQDLLHKCLNIAKESLLIGLIGFGVVQFWRGIWVLTDELLFSDDPIKSGAVSVSIGVGLLILIEGFENVLAAPRASLNSNHSNL